MKKTSVQLVAGQLWQFKVYDLQFQLLSNSTITYIYRWVTLLYYLRYLFVIVFQIGIYVYPKSVGLSIDLFQSQRNFVLKSCVSTHKLCWPVNLFTIFQYELIWMKISWQKSHNRQFIYLKAWMFCLLSEKIFCNSPWYGKHFSLNIHNKCFFNSLNT